MVLLGGRRFGDAEPDEASSRCSGGKTGAHGLQGAVVAEELLGDADVAPDDGGECVVPLNGEKDAIGDGGI